MSVNYASGLSPYPDKGACGMKEKFDSQEGLDFKLEQLTELIGKSKHLVVITGAGISTSAGIPDFRGPNGVWTLEEKGKTAQVDVTFESAKPTFTHMALVALHQQGFLKYLISQNIDGLHVRSGFPRDCLSELHGNMFVEECDHCKTQIIRAKAVPTMALRYTGSVCTQKKRMGKCRGRLKDTILDWEHDLPERELTLADDNCREADVCLCLGTSLQILPCGSMPLLCRKRGGKVIIVNLQPTKRDKQCDLRIYAYVDDVMRHICAKLGVVVPGWAKPHVVLRSPNLSKTRKLPTIEVDQELLVNGLKSEAYYEQLPVNSYKYKSDIKPHDPSLSSNELKSSKHEEKVSQRQKVKRRCQTKTSPKTVSILKENVEDDNDFYKIEIFTDDGDMVESLYVSPTKSDITDELTAENVSSKRPEKHSDIRRLSSDADALDSRIKSDGLDKIRNASSLVVTDNISESVVDNEGPIVIDSDSDDGSQNAEVEASTHAHTLQPESSDLTISEIPIKDLAFSTADPGNDSQMLSNVGDCPVYLDGKNAGFSDCDSSSAFKTDTDITDNVWVSGVATSDSHSSHHDDITAAAGMSSEIHANQHCAYNNIDTSSSPKKKLKITHEND